MNPLIKSVSTAALKALKKAYERDRKNTYRVERDFTFTVSLNLPAYDGRLWRIDPAGDGLSHITLKAYDATIDGKKVCDGASLAPDTPTGVLPSAAIHDPGYLEMDKIAAAWADKPYAPGGNLRRYWWMPRSDTWTAADVRNLFDAIFGDSMRRLGGSNMIVRCYYSAVRCLGGIFHRLAGKSVAIALLALSLGTAGCGGCYSPPHVIEGDFDGPEVIKVEPAEPRQDGH